MKHFIAILIIVLLQCQSYVQAQPFELNKAEQAWLDAREEIIVGVSEKWPPFSYETKSKTLKGFDIAIINILNMKLGGRLRTVIAPWPDLVEKAKQGRVDMLMNIHPTKEREAFFHFTRLYTAIPYVIVASDDSSEIISLKELYGKSVALEKGFFMTRYLKEKAPEIKIREYDNTKTALKAVQKGEVQAYIGNQVVADYMIEKTGLSSDLAVHSFLPEVSSSNAIAVKKEYSPLVGILNRALMSISHREKRLALNHWQIDVKESSLFTPEEIDWIKSHPDILVGAETDWPPFDFVANGKASGYSNDYIRLLAEKAGLGVTFFHGYTWESLIPMLKNHEIDVLPAATNTESRRTFALFSEPYYQNKTGIFVHQDNQNIRSVAELKDKKVAAISGYSTNELLKKQYPDIELVFFDSPLKAMLSVSQKITDAYLEYTTIGNYLRQKHLIPDLKLGGTADFLNPDDDNICLMINKDLPLLVSILDKAKTLISQEELHDLHNRWLLQDTIVPGQTLLTPTEKKWINSLEPLRMGVGETWPPFVFWDENKNPEGISSEYVRILENRLGLKVKVVPLKWQDLLMALEKGDIDFIAGLSQTEARRKYLSFSHPFIHSPIGIITRDDAPFIQSLDKLSGEKVGLGKGFAIQSKLELDFPDMNLRGYDTIVDAFKALEQGEIYAVISDSIVFSYHQQQLNMKHSLKLNNTTPYENVLSFGVRHELATLIPIINRTLSGITPEENNLILEKWTRFELLRTINWTILFSLLGAGILIVLIFLLWNRKLAFEITRRRQSEIRFKDIVDTMADWMWEMDSKGIYLTCTDKVQHHLGYKPEELLGKCVYDFYAPETAEQLRKTIREKVSLKIPIKDLETWVSAKEGQKVCILTNGVAVYDEKNRITGYRGVSSNITERKLNDEVMDFAFQVGEHIDSYSIGEIYQESTEKMMETTNSKYGFLALVDEKKDRINFIYVSQGAVTDNFLDLEAISDPVPIDSGIWSKCIRTQKLYIDNHSSKGFKANKISSKGDTSLERLLLIPIIDSGAVVALWGVANKPSDYIQLDSKIAEILTHYIWGILLRKQSNIDLKESEERLSLAIEIGDVGMYDWEITSGKSFVTDKWLEITGMAREEYEARYSPLNVETFLNYIHPDDQENIALVVENHLKGETRLINAEYRIKSPQKDWVWLSIIGQVVEVNDKGEPVRLIGFQQNISERKNAELALKEQELQYRTLFNASSDAIMLLDAKGFMSANPATLEMFCYESEDAFLTVTPALISPKHQPDGSLSALKAQEMMKQAYGEGKNEFEWIHSRKNGEEFCANVRLTAMELKGKKILQATVRDISIQKIFEEELEYLSKMDGLTNIANRRHFDEIMEVEWQRALRNKKPLALIMCDIDFFKAYNDTYGHQGGDEVLKKVAIVMKKIAARPSDLPSRYGGEEFAIVLPETDKEGAILMAQRFCSDIQALDIEHKGIQENDMITVSLGVSSVIPEKKISKDQLIMSADKALYKAKETGRNRVVYQSL